MTESPAFRDHFSGHSAQYARWRPSYPSGLAPWLAECAPSRALALDCGCGSGQFSVLLADAFEQVVATDASQQQIAQARPHERVRYAVARAEHNGLPDASVDLVSVAQAAHWFDLPSFYDEVRRVLRPRGCIALIAYGPVQLEGAAGEVLDTFYGDALAPYWPPERSHVDQGYRTLDFPFEALATPTLDMRVRWSLEQLLGYVGTWSAVQRAQARLGDALWRPFAENMARAWDDPALPRQARWELVLRVGRVA